MELSKAHAVIYNHLMDLHRQDPEFRFLLYPSESYLNEQSFINEDHLVISFWKSQSGHYHSLLSPISLYLTTKSSVASVCLVVSSMFADHLELVQIMASKLGPM